MHRTHRMHHTCETCATAYEIPAAAWGRKVRCARCRSAMRIGARPVDGAVWWAAIGTAPRGPYREDEILALAATGDVHARTRMWCAGMDAWERVAESPTLTWVYSEVLVQTSLDPRMARVSVFDRAALTTDGRGWFPDPTLASGVVLLDDNMQRALTQMARAKAQQQRRPLRAVGTRVAESIVASTFAALVGVAAAAGGIVWFIMQGSV